MFICYPYGEKTYKLYDPISHKITISRNVVFCENHFLFYFGPPSKTLKFFLPKMTHFDTLQDSIGYCDAPLDINSSIHTHDTSSHATPLHMTHLDSSTSCDNTTTKSPYPYNLVTKTTQ